jgi:flagellar biosynthetic protein FliR
MFDYFINAMKHLFIMSFVISFPIVAFSLLSDIIFGMIMKTMPGFNLMVVGFPIKIVLSIIIIMVILAPMSVVFHNEFLIVLDHLRHFF